MVLEINATLSPKVDNVDKYLSKRRVSGVVCIFQLRVTL